MDTNEATYTGKFGTVKRIWNDSADRSRQLMVELLVSAPYLHPHFSKFYLGAITLENQFQMPNATKFAAQSTHQVSVFALNPAVVIDEENLFPLSIILPPIATVQIRCSDEHIYEHAFDLAKMMVDGRITGLNLNRFGLREPKPGS